MMEPDIENNKKDKRKTLNIDLSVYETKVSAARLHYQGLLRQEIQSNLQKINWSPHETFSYEIVNSTTQEDKEYKLKCILCPL